MYLTPPTRRILTLNPRVFISGSRVYRRNTSTSTQPDDTRSSTSTSSAKGEAQPEKGKELRTEEPKAKRKMRLPYVTDPPPAATPEEQAIIDAVRARRAPRPLQPLDLTLLVSFSLAFWSLFPLVRVLVWELVTEDMCWEVVWGRDAVVEVRVVGVFLCNGRWREEKELFICLKKGDFIPPPSFSSLPLPSPPPPPQQEQQTNNPPQHSPPVTLGWNHFLSAIRTQTTSIPPDLRELAICRVAIVNRAWYEWMHHAPLASAAGVSPAGMEACKDSSPLVLEDGIPEGSGLTETQWVVLCYADEMTRNVEVREGTAGRVRGTFGERGTVEVTATVSFFFPFSSLWGLFGGLGNGLGWVEGSGWWTGFRVFFSLFQFRQRLVLTRW